MFLVRHADLEKFLDDYDYLGPLPLNFIGEYIWIGKDPSEKIMAVWEPSRVMPL